VSIRVTHRAQHFLLLERFIAFLIHLTGRFGSCTQFYEIWKTLINVKEVLELWGYPRTESKNALDVAMRTEFGRRVKEFQEVSRTPGSSWYQLIAERPCFP
jgi:hypothetical protein